MQVQELEFGSLLFMAEPGLAMHVCNPSALGTGVMQTGGSLGFQGLAGQPKAGGKLWAHLEILSQGGKAERKRERKGGGSRACTHRAVTR